MLAPRGIATNRKLNLKNSVIVLKCEYCFNPISVFIKFFSSFFCEVETDSKTNSISSYFYMAKSK